MNLLNMKSILIFLIFALISKPSFAYFDPGAIALFFQLLLAGIVGGLVYLKFYSIKILDFFKNLFKNKKKK